MINLKIHPVKLSLMNLKICKWFIFRKNQRQIVGDQTLRNCHHNQLSPYLQVFNHRKPDLKPLPFNLKNTFLGENETFPVIISSADHLSRLIIDCTSDTIPIDDYFPDESLLSISATPWFANIVNFLATRDLPAHWNSQEKKKFLNEVKNFYWDDLYLFKYCPDQIF